MRPTFPMLALLLLASMASFVADAQGTETQEWSGVVTWEGSRTIAAGTTVRVAPGSHILGGDELRVEGRLLVEGTAEAPVVVEVPLRFDSEGASGRLTHARFLEIGIDDGAAAVTVLAGDVALADSTFTGNARAVTLRGAAASASFERVAFVRNGAAEVARDDTSGAPGPEKAERPQPEGVTCATIEGYTHCSTQPGPLTLEKGHGYVCFQQEGRVVSCAYAVYGPAVLVAEGAAAMFDASRFDGNAYALTLRDAGVVTLEAARFTNNTFAGITVDRRSYDTEGHSGAAAGESTRLRVSNSSFIGTAGPVGVGGLEALDVPYGVGFQGGPVSPAFPDAGAAAYEFRGNLFSDNHVAVLIEGAERQPWFESNNYTGNVVAIAAYDAAGVFRGEDIRDSVLYDVYIYGSTGQLDLRESRFDPTRVKVAGQGTILSDWGLITAASGTVLLAVGTVLLAFTEVGRYALGRAVFALPFAARFVRGDLADQASRQRLLERIGRDPGIHLRALAKATDVAYGAAVYHLHLLEREGLVRSRRDGFYRRYYTLRREHAPLTPPRLPEMEHRILAIVRRHPGITQKQTCDLLGISKQLLNYHTQRLEEANLLARRREGRNVTLNVAGHHELWSNH